MALALIPADICLFVIHELLGLAAFPWVWQDMCCISFNNSTLTFQRCWGTWQHWWNPEAAWTFSRRSIGMSPEAHHWGLFKTRGTSRFNRSQDRAAFALCFWRFFDSGSPSAQLMEMWKIPLKELLWNRKPEDSDLQVFFDVISLLNQTEHLTHPGIRDMSGQCGCMSVLLWWMNSDLSSSVCSSNFWYSTTY